MKIEGIFYQTDPDHDNYHAIILVKLVKSKDELTWCFKDCCCMTGKDSEGRIEAKARNLPYLGKTHQFIYMDFKIDIYNKALEDLN